MRMKFIRFSLITTVCLFWLLSPSAEAQKKAEAEEYLTRGDVIKLLSATDLVRKKMNELFSWTTGYDASKMRRTSMTPVINYLKVIPRKAPPDDRTTVDVLASVDDPDGLKNIAGVRADLSAIGRLPNTMLVDTGFFGDSQPKDGVYTLQTSVSPKVNLGVKEIPVAVTNKKGWLALAKTTLDVQRNPVIIEAQVLPREAPADGMSPVTIMISVDNPGRIEDVLGVVANLKGLGLEERFLLRNDGMEGDTLAGDDAWTGQFILPETVLPGTYSVPVEVTNLSGGAAVGMVAVTVIK